MKYHAVLIQAVVDCLKDIFEGNYYADKVLEKKFKNNQTFGKRDRQFIAETVYDMTRFWLLLKAYDEQDYIPQNYFIRYLTYEYWKNGQSLKELITSKFKHANLNPDFEVKKLFDKQLTEQQKLSFPEWFYNKVKAQYPAQFASILNALNKQASVYLRVNTLKTLPDVLQKKLQDEGVQTEQVSSDGITLKLKERSNVFKTNAFKEGLFEVQDRASQQVAIMLNPQPGQRVADVCAGAGGKTLHIASLMKNKGSLLASDVHEKKIQELKKRATRAGVSNLKVQLVNSSKDIKKHYEKFDAVLIDAPCSGSGVIRRNPDSKWKFTSNDLGEILKTQKEVLNNYAMLLKPRGNLVYATCSIFKEENQDQVEAFLKEHPEFKLISQQVLTPDQDDQDGFFISLIMREAL